MQHLSEPPQQLIAAMRHATLNGGKRLRAALIYALGEMTNTDSYKLHAAACAIECIHAYSMVHDDLPAMDDDDTRRGKPSCHIAFDEATAILAGDALQTFAFELLADPELNPQPAKLQIQMVQILAKASGASGMVLGQALDIAAEQETISLDALINVHKLKTGALISAALELGWLATGIVDQAVENHLLNFSNHIGLAYQIHDDILDVTQNAAQLGKPANSDLEKEKSTFVTLLGLEKARDKAEEHLHLALDTITLIKDSERLQQLAKFMLQRKY